MNSNKQVVQEWFEIAWKRKELSSLDGVISPEHPLGLQGIQKSFASLYRAFPDLQAEIADQIAENDKVVTRLTIQATYAGRYHKWMAIYIHRIKDGKIAEVWRLRDAPTVSLPQA